MLHCIRLGTELVAKPAEIYAMYLDAKTHAAITGAPVTVAAREGAKFSAFGGALSGRILHLVPGRMIVQAWRSTEFKRSDADSILILTMLPHGRNGTLLDLQHVNVPAQDYAGISRGWEQYYFAPWRDYLAQRHGKRAAKAKKMN
jgi:activator of HSP90 ATPase